MGKRNNLKSNSRVYTIARRISIVIEVVAYLIFIFGVVGTIVSFIYIFILFSKQDCAYTNAISIFGTFATVSIIPFLGILAPIIISYKDSISKIENDLAKCQDIVLQFKKLPEGADMNSAQLLQAALLEERGVLEEAEISTEQLQYKTLLDYSWLINVNFKQDISEFYRITLCDMEIVNFNYNSNSSTKQTLRDINKVTNCPCIIRDVSGANLENEGEQIYIFFDKDLENPNDKGIEDFLFCDNQMMLKRCLRFKLNFAPKDFSNEGKISFPITKKVSSSFLNDMLRRRQVETALEFKLSANKDGKLIDTQIINVSFKIVKDLTWCRYLKFKKKILNR